jgi:hypothetical protein
MGDPTWPSTGFGGPVRRYNKGYIDELRLNYFHLFIDCRLACFKPTRPGVATWFVSKLSKVHGGGPR